jgi:O-antigen/teichoic acid export membrane protein
MRRVMGNFWLLIRGRGAAAVMAFGATALMARSLGPTEYGLVVLMHTYAMLVRALFDFGSVEAIVQYGVPAHQSGDHNTLGRLIKVCRRIDRQSSLAATVLALCIAPFAGPLMGMDQEHVILLAGYSLVLITTGVGGSIGILRLYDRFDLIGQQLAIAPTIRFIGVFVAWWFNAPIQVFVSIWGGAYVVENLFVFWHARRQYKTQIKTGFSGDGITGAAVSDFVGLKKFLWVTYWQSNLDALPKHITTVFVGYLLGPAEAGLLRLAREIASTLAKPAILIRQVVFLDLTRTWHQGSDDFAIIANRTALLGGAAGMLFVVTSFFGGEYLLAALVGQDFIGAAPVLTLMFLAATLDLVASPLRSALYAIGKATKVLRLYIASTALYLIFFVLLTSEWHLIGAGVAASIAAALPSLGMYFIMRQSRHALKDNEKN